MSWQMREPSWRAPVPDGPHFWRRCFLKAHVWPVDTSLVVVCGSEGAALVSRARRSDAAVLIVAPERERRARLAELVERSGLTPVAAEAMSGVTRELELVLPRLVVIDVPVPDHADWALDLVSRVRGLRGGDAVPIVVVSAHPSREFSAAARERGADDVFAGEHDPDELVGIVRGRVERPPVPRNVLTHDPVSGVLTEASFAEATWRELERVAHGGRPGVLALLQVDELPELEALHGIRARDELVAQLAGLIASETRTIDYVGHARGVLAVLLPATTGRRAHAALERLAREIVGRAFTVAGTAVSVTPVIGYASYESGPTRELLEERAWIATMRQAEQLDLHPTEWTSSMSAPAPRQSRVARWFGRVVTPVQVISQQLACLLIPLALYGLLFQLGLDVTGVMYLVLVFALGLTALAIWIEGIAALRRPKLPAPPWHLPSAAAIIAAYLPNEADTVLEAVEAHLAQDYPNLEVILAYNTPYPLAVEDDLQLLAERDPRFKPVRIEGSVSKAQNVNAALAHVRSEIVGVFDADHHPARDAFFRAACWLTSGTDVVQGHCVVRNGGTNLLTKLVATEFESIYAVSHPGRARVHGFGIFGGSNGYWRTTLLREKRMRGFMLTEDIDSSMRVVREGGRIVSDPDLVSTELAPESWRALWNQRMRWAQGWHQVSRRHLGPMLRRPGASMKSRLGAFYLLAWREAYPWVSLQMFPLIAFWLIRGEPPINWFVPIFVATTLFTLSAGPIQVAFAAKLAHPAIKAHRRWFWLSLVGSVFFYTEFKNVISRTAQIKELMGERAWKVTPRAGGKAVSAAAQPASERRSPASVGAPLRRAEDRVVAVQGRGSRDPLHRIASVLEEIDAQRA